EPPSRGSAASSWSLAGAGWPIEGTSGGELLHRRDEQVGLEGLDDPALGARLLPALHQRRLPFRRQHDDGHAGVRAVRLDLLDQLEPALLRHVDVAAHGGDRSVAADLGLAILAVRRLDYVEAGLS